MEDITASSFNYEIYTDTYTGRLTPDGFQCLGKSWPMCGDFIEVTDNGICQRIWRHTCCFKKTPPHVHFLLLSEDYHRFQPYALMWLDDTHDEFELRPRRLLPLSTIDISINRKERSITFMLANGKRHIFKVYKPVFKAYDEEDLEDIFSDWDDLLFLMTLNDTKLRDVKGTNESLENYESSPEISEAELQELAEQLKVPLPVVNPMENEVPM